MTLAGYFGTDYVLLSYDVSGAARSAAVEVCRIIFGRLRAPEVGARSKEPGGFIHRPGVVWVGQSVFFLPPRDADELRQRIERLGARVTSVSLTVPRGALSAFRRPGWRRS